MAKAKALPTSPTTMVPGEARHGMVPLADQPLWEPADAETGTSLPEIERRSRFSSLSLECTRWLCALQVVTLFAVWWQALGAFTDLGVPVDGCYSCRVV